MHICHISSNYQNATNGRRMTDDMCDEMAGDHDETRKESIVTSKTLLWTNIKLAIVRTLTEKTTRIRKPDGKEEIFKVK